jgi:glycosyltransferase involved in cell wall biosynthesis
MSSAGSPKRVLFVYLGRRGALSQFTLEIARAAPQRAVLAISRQNELFPQIASSGAPVVAVDTFARDIGAVTNLYRVPGIRRRMLQALRDHSASHVIVLMPHVWTPLIAPAIKRAGARYTVVVHDATRHPGDNTGRVNPWLMRDVRLADRVVTLSRNVAERLTAGGIVPAERVRTLFHPILGGQDDRASPVARGRDRIGFLFFGRIMSYKGLPLFAEACEALRREGHQFDIGVVGRGYFAGLLRTRFERLGAEIVNRWIAHDDIRALLLRYDAVVVPSTEASQSGVVAVAHGCGLPAIVTPVGGQPEQVEHGVTGMVASSISAEAIAAEMRRFLLDPDLRHRLRDGVQAHRGSLSMTRFVDAIVALS